MSLISESTVCHYMSALVGYARSYPDATIDLSGPAFAKLRKRRDYLSAIRMLEVRGYVYVTWADDDDPWIVSLYPSGYAYLETHRAAVREQRWTRGLAIAALVISLSGLLYQFYRDGVFDAFIPSRACPPVSTPAPPG